MQFCTGRKKIHPWNFFAQDYKCPVWKQASTALPTKQGQSGIYACLELCHMHLTVQRPVSCVHMPFSVSSWCRRGLTVSEMEMSKIMSKNPSSYLCAVLFLNTKMLNTGNEKCTCCISCPVLPGVNLPWSSCEQHFWIAKPCGFSMWILEVGGCFPWEQSSLQRCCWDFFSLSVLWILFLLIYYDLCGS